jgi:hypothetical protein
MVHQEHERKDLDIAMNGDFGQEAAAESMIKIMASW